MSDSIRDTWVLVLLLLSWIALLISWLLRHENRFQLNEIGILVKVRTEKQQEKQAKKAGLSRFLYRADGTLRVRTFAAFCDGSDPPPAPGVTFQEPYTSSKRKHVYKTLFKGALVRCWRFICTNGLLAVSLSWWIRNCEVIANELNTDFMNYASVFENMKAAAEIHSMMLPLASFVLALYMNQKMAWFNSVIDESWGVQGKMADLALTLSSCARDCDDSDVRAAKYRLYRYLNVAHLCLYRTVSANEMSRVTLDDVLNIGLLTPAETKALQRSVTPRSTALLWTSLIFQELAKKGRIPDNVLPRVLEIVTQTRGKMDTLAKELTRVTPISFVQLLQLMIDILLFLTPPCLAYKLETQRDGYTVYLWPAVGSMVLSLFYQGGLKFICSM